MHFADPECMGDGPFMAVKRPGGLRTFIDLDLLALVIDAQVLTAASVAQDVTLCLMSSHL